VWGAALQGCGPVCRCVASLHMVSLAHIFSSLSLDVMKGLDNSTRLHQLDIRLSIVASLTMLLSSRSVSAYLQPGDVVAPPKFSLDTSSDALVCAGVLPYVCATLRFVIDSEPGLLGAGLWVFCARVCLRHDFPAPSFLPCAPRDVKVSLSPSSPMVFEVFF
jgi:hypothetical protein